MARRVGGLERANVPGESVTVETNGVSLHTVQAGPKDGPLVVLLHGFPEFWYCWHNQIRPLSEAGYRVVVPDQRGYNISDKPDDVDAYHIDELAVDVAGILDACGRETAHVAGHDTGGSVAWWLALHHPERVETLSIVNVPHPTVIRTALGHRWRQRLRSSYALFFQVPIVPEAVTKFADFRLPVWMMQRTSQPGTFSATDFARYREAWGQPDALSAMVNWYRAAGRSRPQPDTDTVEPPTRIIWGTEDAFLETTLAHESTEYCRDGRVTLLHGVSHWVPHEEPVRVTNLLLDQFA